MPRGRGLDLIVHERSPFNAGPRPEALGRSLITPASAFFVRAHGPAPRVSKSAHRVRVGGMVGRPLALTVAELEAHYPRRSLVVTIVCAGNRRSELHAFRAVLGEIPWGGEAVGTARFEGVRLKDVIADARPSGQAAWACFEGADRTAAGGAFGAAVPLSKAMGNETMVATRMNGAPLPVDHGGPVRVVVPGYIGARSVKWLARVDLTDRPPENPYFAQSYRLLPRGARGTAEECARAGPLQEVALNCAILMPREGARVRAGSLTVTGYALGRGGRKVAGVEVSADGGRSWRAARLRTPPHEFSWSFWDARIEVAPGERTLAARATDGTGEQQPSSLAKVWNLRGYANNAVHRVRVKAKG